MDLRPNRRELDDADQKERVHSDTYSRLLGDDWEPVGDGTYRYVGQPKPLPHEPPARRLEKPRITRASPKST